MSSSTQTAPYDKKIILGLSAVFGSMVLLSRWFSEKLWALHDLWFLDKTLIAVIVVTAFISAIALFFNQSGTTRVLAAHWGLLFATVVIGIGFLLSIHSFPIVFDDFGNAFQYREYSELMAGKSPPNVWSDLLSFQVEPSGGRKTVLSFYASVSYLLQLNYSDVFRWSGILSAVIFCISSFILIFELIENNLIKVVAAIFTFTAPVTMVFYHHFEIYAPVYASIALWMVVFIQFERTRKLWWLLVMAVFGMLCFKLHPLCLILFIGVLLSTIARIESLKDKFTWKNVFLFLHLPLALAGLVVYFFVVEDYNDPRFLDGVKDSERLFLPILSPLAPLDNYNLFSFNHLFDYLNAVFLWSIPALIVLAYVLLSKNLVVHWNRARILIPLNMGLMVAAVLFAINPLLSMPMDRDLFMFPSLFFMIGAFSVLGEVDGKRDIFMLAVLVFFSLLQLPRFIVNNNPQLLSTKLEETGKHVFKTYHIHSSRILINALNLTGNIDDYLKGKERLLEELKPYANDANDPKYANLLMDDGYYFLRFGNNPQRAAVKLKAALYYNPQSEEIRALLQEANSQLQK